MRLFRFGSARGEGGPERGRDEPARPRIVLSIGERPLYAVGDVHGALGPLKRLDAMIAEDAADGEGRPLVVMLGDLIDRGPHSAQVIDHVRRRHPDFDRLCLAGNHERLALACLDGRLRLGDWLALGGDATLRSLGVEPSYLRATKPDAEERRAVMAEAFGTARLAFLRAMPVLARLGSLVLVHGGLGFDRAIDEHDDAELTNLRPPFGGLAPGERPRRWVVHGHTPTPQPQVAAGRVGLDTEAWATGRLTALRIERGRSRFLTTPPDAL